MAEPIQPSDDAHATAISIAAAMVSSGEIFEALRNADQPEDAEELALLRARLIGRIAAEMLNPSQRTG
jgi:hypothetical protein